MSNQRRFRLARTLRVPGTVLFITGLIGLIATWNHFNPFNRLDPAWMSMVALITGLFALGAASRLYPLRPVWSNLRRR